MKLVKFLLVQIVLLGSFLIPFNLALALDDDTYSEEALPEVEIINTQDFRLDSHLAIQKQTPILILFAMQGCAYCQYVEEEHLKPMLRNSKYGEKVIIRRVMTDDFSDLIDFDGKTISNDDFSNRYGAYLTPTVVFLNHEGKQLSRIRGVRNTEFYGGDLDDSLDRSLRMIRNQLLSMK